MGTSSFGYLDYQRRIIGGIIPSFHTFSGIVKCVINNINIRRMDTKKVSTFLLSTALLLSPLTFSSQAEASTLNQLVPTVPSDSGNDELVTYGAYPPGIFASTHDISVNAYNYQVIKVGSGIYTDKFIKGKKSMTVTLSDWAYEEYYDAAVANGVTVTLYSTSEEIASKKLTVSNNSGSVSFTGLDSSKKYYVLFTVPRNGVTYSFNGSIK